MKQKAKLMLYYAKLKDKAEQDKLKHKTANGSKTQIQTKLPNNKQTK